MDVEFGNAGRLDTEGTGWIVGFSPWARSDSGLRFVDRDAPVRTLCIKWMNHPLGDPNGGSKPISEGRTISVLVSDSGRFRVAFSRDPAFPEALSREFLLGTHGDYVIWGEGLFHRWAVEEPCTIATVRWMPADDPRS